jgi:hypothetical protein
LISYITFLIIYQLALAFIGVSTSVRRLLLPVLMATVTGCISKIYLGAPASVQTVLVTAICAGLLYWFYPIDWLLSLIGSLMAAITLTLGSMLLACPLFIRLGYTLPVKSGAGWLLLALLELVIPTLVLGVLKINKFNLTKYLHTPQ